MAFYERLGFTQVGTTDTWPHPYGVMTDGKLFLGLHQFKFPSPTITYVHPDVAAHAHVIEKQGIELAWKRVGDDAFNELGFFDPSGQPVRVQEAPTHFASRSRARRDFAVRRLRGVQPARPASSNRCARSGSHSASSRWARPKRRTSACR